MDIHLVKSGLWVNSAYILDFCVFIKPGCDDIMQLESKILIIIKE